MDEEEQEQLKMKAEAQKEKEAGNAAYKARQFEKAVQHYDRAIELDDSDISFLTNRQAIRRFVTISTEFGFLLVCLKVYRTDGKYCNPVTDFIAPAQDH